VRAQCVELLDEHKIDAMVQLRRTTLAAHSVGLATASVGASTGAGAAVTNVVHAVGHIGVQVFHTGEDYVTGEVESFLGTPDVDANEGMRPNSLVFEGIGDGARAIIDDEGSTKSCFTDSVAQVRSTVATLASLLMTSGQLKLVLGNLQINAYVKTDTIQPRRVASLSLSLALSGSHCIIVAFCTRILTGRLRLSLISRGHPCTCASSTFSASSSSTFSKVSRLWRLASTHHTSCRSPRSW
jgi:hypothetical protein